VLNSAYFTITDHSRLILEDLFISVQEVGHSYLVPELSTGDHDQNQCDGGSLTVEPRRADHSSISRPIDHFLIGTCFYLFHPVLPFPAYIA
jgi:hypothetical protein